MSSQPINKVESKAEKRFREAFQRLKAGAPVVLTCDAEVSQNNVAREAGVDPSALRKSRFPQLVDEIQIWVDQVAAGKRLQETKESVRDRKARNQSLRFQLLQRTAERDQALSKLLSAQNHILELHLRLAKQNNALPPEAAVIEFPNRRRHRRQ